MNIFQLLTATLPMPVYNYLQAEFLRGLWKEAQCSIISPPLHTHGIPYGSSFKEILYRQLYRL